MTLNVSSSALGRGKFGEDQEYCPFRGREGKKGHVLLSQTWGNYRRERGTQILGMEGRKVVREGGKEEGRKKVGRKEESGQRVSDKNAVGKIILFLPGLTCHNLSSNFSATKVPFHPLTQVAITAPPPHTPLQNILQTSLEVF